MTKQEINKLVEDIKNRVEVLKNQNMWELDNAWNDLQLIINVYHEDNIKATFKEWYDDIKDTLWYAETITDIDEAVGYIDSLYATDINEEDFELFDKVFMYYYENLKN